MKVNKSLRRSLKGPQMLAVLVLALVMVLGAGLTLFAGPPTTELPEIYKEANKTRMQVGESVRFTITVANPGGDNQATWYGLTVTDQVDPAFRVDEVQVTPAADDVTTTGNTVVVEVDELQPGESFVITIDCTLVGPADSGDVLVNEATLRYDDESASMQPPIVSNAVRIVVWEPTVTLLPPSIDKRADKDCANVGEPVRFTIAVANPGGTNQAVWRGLRVWDEIDPALRIDKVEVVPPADEVQITGNVVWVKVNRLEPGESFAITIDCTLVGPAEPGDTIENFATLKYEAPGGEEQPDIVSDPVDLCVPYRILLPMVFK